MSVCGDATAAFATDEDLEVRWRPLTDDEIERANVFLEDASDMIRVAYDTSRIPSSTLKRVVCAMVKRAMMASQDDAQGEYLGTVSSATQTTGPFSTQVSYANPTGDLYISKAESRSLKAASGHRGRAFEIDLLAGRS